MKAPLIVTALCLALASAAIAQPPPTPAEQVKTLQSRHAQSLQQHAGLAAVDDAVKADCITKAADDKAKVALCPCAGAVTVQYWMDDAFMRQQVEAYLKAPSPQGVSELLKYQGPELYQICQAAVK
jgi:alpha-beta hydrolase superfamily lysophospholipase